MKEQGISPAALVAALNGDIHNAMVASTPGGIERQEAQGQRDLCAGPVRLPKRMNRTAVEALGIKIGADADDLFVFAELPKGWQVKATDHSMWSDLLDESGEKRGAIFYKAAFYDRNAELYLN